MSVQHVNFYENLAEAQMRLRNTVVLYDREPYYVRAICNHHKDGIFRVYLDPLAEMGGSKRVGQELYYGMENFTAEDPALGRFIDSFMEKTPGTLIRKQMNSPLFNRFRPFPLGMVNIGEDPSVAESLKGKCYYIERQPTRNREQGLTAAACNENLVMLGERPANIYGRAGLNVVSMYTRCFSDMIMGKYPTYNEAYLALIDPEVSNEAIAFHRNFALIRGPVETMFLGYKDKVVGLVTHNTNHNLILGKEYRHLKEAVEELNVFGTVR